MKSCIDRGKRQLAGLLVFCVLVPGALAEQADRSKPVNVEADSVQMDDLNKTSLYQGDVVLQQGTLLMRADRMSVRQDAQGYSSATAFGAPVYFRQKEDGSDEYLEGWADRIDLDNKQNTAVLTGHARLKRGVNEMHASSMQYNTVTQQFWAKRDPNTPAGAVPDRVRTAIFPKSAPQPAEQSLPLQGTGGLLDGQATHE